MDKRLQREFKTVKSMIEIYCRKKHISKGAHKTMAPCVECSKLIDYAQTRLEACKFGSNKAVCAKCKVHCYKPEMREEIKKVMRIAGPRMIYKHPIMLVRHVVDMAKY